MNVFGERQHPEKFIPMCIKKARDGETVTIHELQKKLALLKTLHSCRRCCISDIIFMNDNMNGSTSRL